LKEFGQAQIFLAGRLCYQIKISNDKSGLKLSEQRAKAVLDAIIKTGIDKSRLTSAGFGEEKPIADNKTEKGKSKNRRVELIKK